MDEQEEYIDFMVKYKDWISIKRLAIRGFTKPEEVSYHLASIKAAMDSRAYRILGIDTDALDRIAEEAAGGRGKGPGVLSTALGFLSSAEAKGRVRQACADDTVAKLAQPYIVNRILAYAGYEAFITPAAMARLYPGLKPPKAPGMGRHKKKRQELQASVPASHGGA